ncbi:unnamed protein product [Caenorhabditis brenneri]
MTRILEDTGVGLIILSSISLKVYSPAFAASHSNFLGKLADTLTEKGHNVTYLVPVVNQLKEKECIGVKVTKDVVIVDVPLRTVLEKENKTADEEILDVWWNSQMDSSNSKAIFQWFSNEMKTACNNFLSRRDIFEEMKTNRFDVAILEPISVCGLGFVDALGIEKTILASSSTFYDVILPYIGEPLDYSYVPSGYSITGEDMSLSERFENWMVSREISIALEDLFDGEMEIYQKRFGVHLPHWKDLLSSSSIHFVNSNPIFDFPRLMLEKTVSIGGISIDIESIESQKLSQDWNIILNQRPYNMLISFGTLVTSTHMPMKWKNGLLNVIKSMSNVTFIWKYESDEHSFADGISNLYFTKWVPQTSILNDDRLTAFLTHGGLGSTMEIAHIGKPALVIPVFADQNRNANTLERHKGALYLHKTLMSNFKTLRNAFDKVLFDESYARNARKLAEVLKNQPNNPKESVIKYTEFVGK